MNTLPNKIGLQRLSLPVVALSVALSPQQAQSAALDWEDHDGGSTGATNSWTDGATSANLIADGVTFDMNITGSSDHNTPGADPKVSNASGSYSYGNPSAKRALKIHMNFSSISNSVTYRVDFSHVLSNFTIGLIDIDSRFSSDGTGSYYSAYRDTVTVRGFGASGDVFASVTLDPLAPSSYHSVEGADGNVLVASQTAYDLANPLDDPLTTLLFSQSITGIEVVYSNTQFDTAQLVSDGFQVDDLILDPAFTDPAAQLIRIGDFGWTSAAAIPEPSSMSLLGLGGICLLMRRKH